MGSGRSPGQTVLVRGVVNLLFALMPYGTAADEADGCADRGADAGRSEQGANAQAYQRPCRCTA
ncbi:MAG: hypothetical protein IH582_14355 [Afipia sp.]|nr:hypothetical protein [Afipia sp.]